MSVNIALNMRGMMNKKTCGLIPHYDVYIMLLMKSFE